MNRAERRRKADQKRIGDQIKLVNRRKEKNKLSQFVESVTSSGHRCYGYSTTPDSPTIFLSSDRDQALDMTLARMRGETYVPPEHDEKPDAYVDEIDEISSDDSLIAAVEEVAA